MFSLDNIQPLTVFRRRASDYIEQVRNTRKPMILTVNGVAAVVVQDAHTFQEMVDRLQQLEEELRQMKFLALKQEIAVGMEQLETGQFTDYDEEALDDLFTNIKLSGRQKLVRDQ